MLLLYLCLGLSTGRRQTTDSPMPQVDRILTNSLVDRQNRSNQNPIFLTLSSSRRDDDDHKNTDDTHCCFYTQRIGQLHGFQDEPQEHEWDAYIRIIAPSLSQIEKYHHLKIPFDLLLWPRTGTAVDRQNVVWLQLLDDTHSGDLESSSRSSSSSIRLFL